ncbi:MAG: adenosine deaminase [Actinobacteria bacterium]|nr:adenosine deaminase [Actinomycetota bacterium]
MLPPEIVRRAPKALLHDHLDGGLRPQTIVELAAETGYDKLPTTDAEELGRWFVEAADSGSLVRYLETFAHTVGVMQTPAALARVARECAEDLAADGVVYAEVRFAPELHVERGLALPEVVEAVLDGFRQGEAAAAAAGNPIRVGTLLTAMRTAARSREIAELVVAYRDAGVVGFDIAGAEAGYPPSRHQDAFDYVRGESCHITIHAGEAFGLPSIHEAVAFCGCDRLGHGVRIVDDITVDASGEATLGRLARYVRDQRIPLEMCPTSNVQTGAAPSYAEHPIGLLTELRFRVTVNTDNRLMSGTSMSKEMLALSEAFGWGLDEMRWVTINALKSAFIPFPDRLALIEDVVKPGYAALAAELS